MPPLKEPMERPQEAREPSPSPQESVLFRHRTVSPAFESEEETQRLFCPVRKYPFTEMLAGNLLVDLRQGDTGMVRPTMPGSLT